MSFSITGVCYRVWITRFAFCCVMSLLIFGYQTEALPQQVQIQIEGRGLLQNRVLLDDRLGVPAQEYTGSDQEFALGATLKTDPDLESILETAARYQADGNWDVASQLWQAVLERSSDTLVSTDGKTYRSMMEQVERILATLPPDGLAVYRIVADANAREILARAGNEWDPKALGQVTERYFPSSVGDDAALRLAGLLMDQYEFVGAQRILEKILYLHPDPDVDHSAVITRLALCHFVSGYPDLAAKLLEGATEAAQTPSGKAVLELLAASTAGNPSTLLQMTTGSFAGLRVQASLPEPVLQNNLIASWQFCIDPETSYNSEDVKGRILQAEPGAGPDFVAKNGSAMEQSAHKEWRKNNWRPTGQPLVSQGLVIFKTPASVVAWPLEPATQPAWASVWMNRYEPDNATLILQQMKGNGVREIFQNGRGQTLERPADEITIQLFGDDVHAAMTLANNRLYSIEGASYSTLTTQRNVRNRNQGFQWGVHTNRSRTNWLACYDATTGQALWKIPDSGKPQKANREPAADPADGAEQPEAGFHNGGFMGPPVVSGPMVFAPVNHSGAIYVYCFDADHNGSFVWKTYLCDEPESGARPWAPITITADGSDLFVGSGMGVVFCLDSATGNVRFGQRYERNGVQNMGAIRNGFQPNSLTFEGWDEDLIIPWGAEMLCLPSDASTVFSIDRRTGNVLWHAGSKPLGEPLEYVLGIHNRVLYAAGRSTIVAFDLDGQGRMLWGGESMFGNDVSYGRGILTPDGIYLPVGNSIWKYSLEPESSSPLPVAQASVNLGMNAPVGNLVSDGKNLWVQNANRLLRLEPAGGPAEKKTSLLDPSTGVETDSADKTSRISRN